MRELIVCALALLRNTGYRPQPLSFQQIQKWLRQFEKSDRPAICSLLQKIVYFSEAETRRILVHQNDVLLRRLRQSRVKFQNVVYVQLHDAGSSSPAMLNMLRDDARLEPLGCRFMDSRDALGMNRLTNKLTEGAIVYIDDFIATGDQFCEARDFMIPNVVGNFAEFLLIPCICEEAYRRLAQIGVEVLTGEIHGKAKRPLHEHSSILGPEVKERLRNICVQIDERSALGYKGVASMVVFYRNAPDTLPVIFRGNVDQDPHFGIFPRISDLPKRVIM